MDNSFLSWFSVWLIRFIVFLFYSVFLSCLPAVGRPCLTRHPSLSYLLCTIGTMDSRFRGSDKPYFLIVDDSHYGLHFPVRSKVIPIWIIFLNKFHFPLTPPLFDYFFPFNRIHNVLVSLIIDEDFQTILFSKPFN